MAHLFLLPAPLSVFSQLGATGFCCCGRGLLTAWQTPERNERGCRGRVQRALGRHSQPVVLPPSSEVSSSPGKNAPLWRSFLGQETFGDSASVKLVLTAAISEPFPANHLLASTFWQQAHLRSTLTYPRISLRDSIRYAHRVCQGNWGQNIAVAAGSNSLRLPGSRPSLWAVGEGLRYGPGHSLDWQKVSPLPVRTLV